jgi:hypothetical protein
VLYTLKAIRIEFYDYRSTNSDLAAQRRDCKKKRRNNLGV